MDVAIPEHQFDKHASLLSVDFSSRKWEKVVATEFDPLRPDLISQLLLCRMPTGTGPSLHLWRQGRCVGPEIFLENDLPVRDYEGLDS